ncbi:cysteine-tryptophan domain-containing zinc finger protein 7-like [Malania oleifera]|uniref:cysteine-tryptophan domain-containing zinc finger protein 7-like n=1 Tax=Malania oleifera TaxID=397392 RepID=UPI0025ADF4BB|nr:cysteine-tryptophan domain-containing zinc finger protein 7-like [Malania oleifera]
MEGTEIEEGEACYYKEDDDGTSIDPDNDFSYIDVKIKDVLGHFQKDFEGGVSAENLGAKFGGYGSFLPTYQRSPPIWSHPKSPERFQNHSEPKSLDNLPMEGASQNRTAPSSAPVSVSHRPALCNVNLLHASRFPSGDVVVKQEQCLPPNHVVEQLPMEQATSQRSVPTDHRTLKVRIKVGSDSISQKNAAIYSGLGLDNSPSSSLGKSPEESGGEFQETANESLTSILQIMTTIPVPGGVLLSPLDDSLLCLSKKEMLLRKSKPAADLKGCQEHIALSVDGSDSMRGDGKVLKERRVKLVGKSKKLLELKHGKGIKMDSEMRSFLKGKIDNETPDGKELLTDGKQKPLSKSTCDFADLAKGTGSGVGASKNPNKDGEKCRSILSNLANEEYLESISGQDSDNSEKQKANSSSVGNIRECRVANSYKDGYVDVGEGDGAKKDEKVSAQFKDISDVSQFKEGHNVGPVDCSKKKVVQKIASIRQNEVKVLCRTEKSLYEGKRKSKGNQGNGRPAADLEEESSRVCSPKDGKNNSYALSPFKSKVHNLKSQKDIVKFRGERRESRGDSKSKGMDTRVILLQSSSGDTQKDSAHKGDERELKAFFDKSKGRLQTKKGDKKLTSEDIVKEAPNAGTSLLRDGLTSETAPVTVPAVVIQDNWVCCDSCEKWRLLPFGTTPEQLPEKWLCSMLDWLPGMNRCDISEEETTKALNALYQLPLPENQNNTHNHANGTAFGIMTADTQQLDQNHHNFSSNAMHNKVKKKHGSKEIPRSRQHESLKSRILNDVNLSHSESNLMKKSSFQHSSMSHYLANEKLVHKPKANQINGGAKQTGGKNKREADQIVYGASKKTKTEGAFCTDKHQNSELDGKLEGVDYSSGSALAKKTTGKVTQQHNEYSYSKDAKGTLLGKRGGDKAHVSLNGGPVHRETCNKVDIYAKKRKLKDWKDEQNYAETAQIVRCHIPDTKASMKEESGESEFRNGRKCRVSKMKGKESSTSKGDDISTRKGRAIRAPMSGGIVHPLDGTEEVKNIKKDQWHKKNGNVLSQRVLDGVDMKRDLGSGQASTIATSSSSMVSGSCKSRASFQEAKGSPVESVSSSPFKTSNLDSCTPTRMELLGKVDAARKDKVSSLTCIESLEFPALDYQDTEGNKKFSGTTRLNGETCSENGNSHLVNNRPFNPEHGRDSNDMHSVEHCYKEERLTRNHCPENVFSKKSQNGCLVQSKHRDRSYTSDYSGDKLKVSDPPSEQEEMYPQKSLKYDSGSGIDSHRLAPFSEIETDVSHSCPEQPKVNNNKDEKNHHSKKDSLGKCSNSNRRGNQLKFGVHDGSDAKPGALHCANEQGSLQRNLIQNSKAEISSNQFPGKKTNPMQMELKDGKLQINLQYEDKRETLARRSQSVLGSQKGGSFEAVSADVSVSGDVSKVLKQHGYAGNESGLHCHLGHLPANQHRLRDVSALNPLRKGSSSQNATDALIKAKHLRDYADRLKSSGFAFESNEMYFQSALQFLRGASLMETSNGESDKHGDMTPMQMYGATAEICESCAHEYERREEMAAASLAYKCIEVAYMRVVYCKHSSTGRDRHELQATLQMIPHGESPSSSASDVDNLYNQPAVDKSAVSKGISSHIAGNHVIVARNRPNFIRLLDFTQHVNFAMEASRKSQNAFAAANETLEESQNEGISSVKKVIDFSFQDVEELVNLVQLAMGAISRSGFGGSRD